MKNMYLILLVLILAGSVNAQKVKNGFKGFEWGTPRSEMDSVFSMSSHGVDGPLGTTYRVEIDSLGLADIDSSYIFFFKNKFSGMIATVSGKDDIEGLIESMSLVFGEPKSDDQKTYSWSSAITVRRIHVPDDEKYAILSIYSYTMVEEFNEEEISKVDQDREKERKKIQDDF